MRGGEIMGDMKILVEIIPLVGVEIDIDALQAEVIAVVRKHPGVNANTWVQREANPDLEH